jgi:carbon monoxide dehydrogenase subunit G
VRFEQRIVVEAPVERVAAFLEDVPAAAACIPGVEQVTAAGEPDTYDGRVRVRVGPLGFTVAGRARLDPAEDGAWRLTGEGRDARIGAGLTATLEARLEASAVAQTAVAITADVQFSGRLAEVGQPLIRRKADQMMHDFGENLRRALEA